MIIVTNWHFKLAVRVVDKFPYVEEQTLSVPHRYWRLPEIVGERSPRVANANRVRVVGSGMSKVTRYTVWPPIKMLTSPPGHLEMTARNKNSISDSETMQKISA